MKLAERTFRRSDYGTGSGFGMRLHPIHKDWRMHWGVDYTTKVQKWEQYALEDGVVRRCGADNSVNGGGALFAWVYYPRIDKSLLYYHLDKLMVVNGQKVTEDIVIGLTGTTGYSTGIHLHLEIREGTSGAKFDPESYDYQPKPVKVEPIKQEPVKEQPVHVEEPQKQELKRRKSGTSKVIKTEVER
jgi:murein DD-endopeptidase MepM/ murein hydrolase activator NlpD